MKPKSTPVRVIPTTITKVDEKGKETYNRGVWNVLPPPANACQICAVFHPVDQPHNPQSLYYQTVFHAMVGRVPTWADAVAHCNLDVKAAWEKQLRKLDLWNEPPDGEKPVKHHGVDE